MSKKKDVVQLKALVEEMSLLHPNEKKVKSLMEKLGLMYSSDPVECLEKIFLLFNTEILLEQKTRISLHEKCP